MAENNNNNEYLRKVHERVGQKYAVGSFDSFVESLKNPEKRKKAYDYLSNKYLLDDFETFDNKIKGMVGEVKPTQQSSGSYIGDVVERLGAGAANFAGGALNLLQKGADVFNQYEIVQEANKLIGQGSGGLGEAGSLLKQKGEEWKTASDRYKGKTFFDLAKEGRYGEAMGDLFLGATESLPVSLGIMLTGGTGLATVGAVTASDKYDELRKQNPNMSEAAALGNSVVTGISEAVSEMLGPGVIGKTIKGLYMAGGKKAAAEAMEKGIIDKLTQFVDKHWLAYPIIEEGLTEAVNAAVEYGVDRLTGIERTDDFLQTITEAAGYGAAGGAQFTPITGGFKYMNKRRKDKATRSYNDNLPVGEQLLGENLEQFNAAVTRFQNENRPEQIQNFVNEVARTKGLDNEQTRSLINYTGSLLNYNNYINSVQDQIEEETRRAYDEIDRTANRETNTVMLASMSEGSEPVYVTGGNLVLGNDGQIDYDNSSSAIYYLDENGKVKQGTPQMFATVVSNTPVETLYTEAALSVNERITQQEDNDIRNASFNNGDNVVLPTGETGVVQQYDDDGNMLVNIGGEIRSVAPEGVMNAEEAATVQAEQQAQQEVAEQQQMEMQYPRKGEDIDYAAITDPNMYASALQSEFGEEAGTVLDEMIADKQAELEKASKGKDAITRRRATNKINSELSLLNEARNIITPVQTEEVIEQVNDNVTEPTPVSEDIEANSASELLNQAGINTETGARNSILSSDSKMEGSLNLDGLNGVAENVDSHGIAKGNELEHLINLLENGVDLSEGRRFDTAPLAVSENNEAVGAGIGTASGTSYRNGLFIVAAPVGETIVSPNGETNIKTVLINDMSYEGGNPVGEEHARRLKDVLSQKYKDVDFVLFSEAQSYYDSQSKETQPAEQPLIPTNEQGVPQYHLTSIDNTLDDLLDGSMSIEEVNSFVEENIKAAESELKEVEKRKPKMGTSKADYLAQRDAIQEELNNARQKVEYWNNVKKEITPEEQGSQSLDKWMMEEPMNLQELAAQMLASGRLKLLQSDYKKQTGYGNREARKMFGIFASEGNGGVSLEKAGEIIELRAREEGLLSENQEIELNSGFEALMDVLTGSSTKGDINSYVANNRERILREEREYQEGQEAAIAEQAYGMSLDDYRSYVDATERNIRQSQITDEQYNELQGEIYDEMMAREQEFYEEIDEALEAERQRETEQEVEQEEYIENESREFDSINQGSNELLPETQINQEGRSNVPQESEQTAADIVGEDGATQGNEGIDKDFEELKTRALTVPGVTVFEEVTADDGTKGIRVGNKNSATTYWYEDVSPMVNEELDLANKMLSKLKEKHDSNVVLSKVKNSSDFWEWLKSTGEADSKRGVSGYDIAGFVKGAKEELNNEKLYSDALIPIFEYIKTKYGKPVTSSPVQETEMEMIERVAKEQNEKQKKESVQFVVDNFGETIQHEGDEFRIKGYDGATGKVTIEKNQEENVVPVTEVVRSIFRGEKPTNTTGKKESKLKAQPKNKLVTDERYEELKKRMRAKLGGQMNLGIDPEILAIGTEMAVYHIEKGARKFADYAKNMIDDMGNAIRPYLKAFYNGARDLPEVQQLGWDKDMTSYDEVSNFDTANFGKEETNTVESEQMSDKEKEVDKQAETAKAKIKKERNKKAKNESKDLPLSVNDLFTFNNSENEQGNTEPDKGLGTEARENVERTEQRRDYSGVYGDNVSDENRGGRVSGTDGIKQPVIRNTNNFRFPENGGIEIPSGEIAKLKANIEAIKTLKEVEKSGVPATPEQQSKMAKYVGWGGLAEALNENKYNYRNNRYYADNNWNNKYLSYYEQLKELLTKEEFDSAVKSTTTSHYTPSEIVSTMWKIAERLGFKGGNISEPAMGIGNILGMIPKTISDNSYLSGFEIDSLSGRIAKALYPDADIKVEGYEKSFAPNTKDLVITNVPFGKNAPYDKVLDKQFRKKLGSSYNLHNYFILKGLLELKEGGLGVFVTTSATMDGADSRFREYVSGNNYDLIGAIRLPNNAFLKGAGTSVTTDVIVFRKRKAGESSNGIGFTTTVQIGEGTYQENGEDRIKPIMVNEYFANNPDMMLGEMMTAYDAGSGGLYSGASQTLKANPSADLGKELGNAIEKLPENILSQTVKQKEEEREKTTLKEGTITTSKGKVYVSYQGELKPVDAPDTFEYNGKTRNTADAVNDYNNIKNVLNRLIAEEQTKGANPEPTRKELNKVYDDFVTKYGTLNRNKALDNVFAEDVEHGLPFSLETVKRVPSPTGKSMVWQVSKADGILNKRVSYPFEIPTKAENISDAVNISKSYKGSIDIPYIAEITGKTEEEATREMLETGLAYKDPITGNIIDKNTYLSGNVKDKLLEARAAVEDNPEFQKNVDDLENVQPERVPYGDISFRLGTTWIPEEFINAFAETVVGISYANAMFVPEVEEYIVDKGARITDYAKSGGFKTSRLSAIDIFKAALNQRKPKIYDEVTSYEDGTKKTRKVVNEQETQAAAEKISEMSDKFVEYMDSKTMFHQRIEDVYNDKYNNYVLKKYEKPAFENYPNANKDIKLRDHQTKAVQRCLSESTLLAHQVGTGKTFTMITTAMEMRRLGIANKPMIVVQNATLEDFVRDFYKLYPSAKILSPSKEERNAENRKRLFNLIATGDFDAIVVPQSFMSFIPDSEERKKAYIQKRIDDFEAAIERIDDRNIQERLRKEVKSLRDSLEGVKKTKNAKGKAKTAESITAKTERVLDRRTDDVLTFEQMGVDALFVDEAHNYKKIGFPSKMSNVKGIDTSASQRANSMLLKAQWVAEKNGGRNVILATGTPITNTMAEVWTMMNFVSPDILDAYSIKSFDEFATTFGSVEPSLEFTATGNFKIAERFKSYTNVPELVKAFRSHTDVVLTEDVKEFKQSNNIPKLKDGKMTNVVVEKNEDLEDVMQTLIKELEAFNKLTGKAKKEKSALPLVVFTKAKQAAIDLRLLNPTFPDNPDSKTNKVVENVIELYKESTPDKGTQLIFCDSYQSPSETPKMDLFDVDLSVPQFNLYNDIKRKLIEGGIPASQIAIVSNYEGEKRNALFDKVRNGDVRILIGSTEKMGVGVNVQDRLFALHHIDAPIRPMDFEQRNGRILRQGNLYATWGKPVNVVTYGVKGTLDATAYDRLRIKQNFINQMMKGDTSSRIMEEQDDEDPSGMTFSEMAATLSGDKTAQLLFVAQNKLKKLQNSKRSDLNSKSSMQINISVAKSRLNDFIRRKDEQQKITDIVKSNFPEGIKSVTVKGNTINKSISTELAPIVEQYYDNYTLNRNTPPLKISLNNGKGEAIVHFNEGKMVYNLYVDSNKIVENRDFSGAKGLMSSIDRQLEAQEKNISTLKKKIEDEQNKISGLEEAIKKPWGKEEELKAAQQEVEKLQQQLEEKAKQSDIVRQIESESKLDVNGNIIDETIRYRVGITTGENTNDPYYRFIGEAGAANLDRAEEATTRLDNLSVARQMESEGKDAKVIKYATGWERGADNKWRYETSDLKLKEGWEERADNILGVSLDKVIDDKELLEAYPELKDITVSREEIDGSYAYYTPIEKTITISNKIVIGNEGVLSHEIQHIIQDIEGFAQGGSVTSSLNKILEVADVLGIKDKKPTLNQIRSYIESGYVPTDKYKKVEELANKNGFDNPIDYVNSLSPTLYYTRLAGEVEARNVQSRLNMTPEQRRNSLASETEDVAREDQIFIEDALSRSDARLREATFTPEEQQIISDAQANGTYMKAPNGNDTNLTEKQWAQVRTKAFKDWFGDWENSPEEASKVVDENGEPMVVYHGTGKEFYEFSKDLSDSNNEFGKGLYFTNDYDFAKSYTEPDGNYDIETRIEERAFEIFEQIGREKGLEYTEESLYENDSEIIADYDSAIEQAEKELFENPSVMGLFLNIRNPYVVNSYNSEVLKNMPKESDGIFDNDFSNRHTDASNVKQSTIQYVAFSPNQIKSATDNTGAFSTESEDIRFREEVLEPKNPLTESERKQAVVDELSNSLNTPITVYNSLEEIVDENPRRQRNKRAAKGWYDYKTGEVFVVMPNNNNAADTQATILHEVVAHKGLRGLLGENFETMMDNIFKNVPKNVRQALVVEALSSYNGNVRTATEEYLARIAERGIPEPSIWGKIKSAIKEVFRNMGINLVMTDEDIAYLLWKSKNRLNKGDSFKTMLDKAAKDAEMRSTLLYRNSSMRNGTMLNTHPTQRASMRNTINTLTSRLTPVVKNGYKAFREGYQDRMLPLRDFQEEITNETGHKVADFENAYVYENTVQSKTQYDSNKYKDNILKPLVAEIAKLSKVNGKVDSDKARLVESYMMIKHGLERNALMRERDLAKIENPSPETIEKYRNKDYSGLTALSKEVLDLDVMDEAALTDWVNDFEKSNNTSKLWSLVKTATEATLDKLYQSNMLSRDKMNELKGMYKYYIPLKEWDETTAGEVFDYVEKGYTDKVSNPIKKAKGRTSRAGSVLANIVNDFDNATILGYKNLMKLRLANLVRNSKTNKASVSNMWYVKALDSEGNEVWEPAVPVGLTEDAAKNAEIIADFEEKMQGLAKTGDAKHSHEVLKLGMPIKNWQERQHMIRVKEGGRDMVVYINGDPKVSQAVNGLNRPSLDNSMLQGLNWVKRNMMLNYTSRNINFIARNFVRDMIYTNTMNFVKYGAKFELEYVKNIVPALKALSRKAMGKKAKNAEQQALFDAIDAFERGGGKTGYVEIVGYDKYKREVDKLLRKSAGGNVQVKDVINTVGSFLEQSNDVIENTARFATYLTAKKVGMTELQAIRAAKDVSVNFNRKGSGAMGGIYFQNFYFFFNAAIQGTHNFLSAVKAQPKRAAAAMAMWGTMGFAYSMLMSLLMGDDDEYNQIPDYVRQNNLLIPIPSTEKFALIPLPVELRILFGAGDMFAQASRGEYKGRDFTSDMMAKIMEFSPKSFEGNLSGMSRGLADSPLDLIMKNFTPDAVRPIVDALYFNENFFGKRVSGRNEFNKYVPEFQKVTTGTSKALIKASEKLNEVTGGDYATKGSIDPVLLNPSIAEYLFEQYFGGIGKLISQIYKTSEGAFGDGAELRNIPVVSGLSYDTTNLIPRDYTQKRYDNFVKFYEEAQSRKRMYEKGLFSGEDLSDNFKAFVSDKDYMKYSVIDRYKKIIDSMYDKAKLPMSDDEKKRIFENVRKLKKEMVKQIDKIDNEE